MHGTGRPLTKPSGLSETNQHRTPPVNLRASAAVCLDLTRPSPSPRPFRQLPSLLSSIEQDFLRPLTCLSFKLADKAQ
ncbi:unnamed protein product [Periconia digitata]|uniref:Uncharacterized protein n=1 Tax=Periconia digitata TaxID=1303443 RepID=A0A9W4XQD9_9PLEO|nr:unnamed protein product [Periconia digitata]